MKAFKYVTISITIGTKKGDDNETNNSYKQMMIMIMIMIILTGR